MGGELGEAGETLGGEAVALELVDEGVDGAGELGSLGTEGLLVDAVLKGDGAEGVGGRGANMACRNKDARGGEKGEERFHGASRF